MTQLIRKKITDIPRKKQSWLRRLLMKIIIQQTADDFRSKQINLDGQFNIEGVSTPIEKPSRGTNRHFL